MLPIQLQKLMKTLNSDKFKAVYFHTFIKCLYRKENCIKCDHQNENWPHLIKSEKALASLSVNHCLTLKIPRSDF